MRRPGLAAFVTLLLGAAGVAGAWLLRERAARERVTEQRAVVEAVRRVAALATIEMQVSNWRLRRDTKPLFGFLPVRCEKTIGVFYRGKVAAGFDLAPASGGGLVVDASPTERRARVRLPAPRLLYTDVPAPEIVVADGSVCNALKPEDYTQLHAEARAAVEREAIAAGALSQAEGQARRLVTELLAPFGYEVTVEIGATGPAPGAELGAEAR
jgi:hypothetical protein